VRVPFWWLCAFTSPSACYLNYTTNSTFTARAPIRRAAIKPYRTRTNDRLCRLRNVATTLFRRTLRISHLRTHFQRLFVPFATFLKRALPGHRRWPLVGHAVARVRVGNGVRSGSTRARTACLHTPRCAASHYAPLRCGLRGAHGCRWRHAARIADAYGFLPVSFLHFLRDGVTLGPLTRFCRRARAVDAGCILTNDSRAYARLLRDTIRAAHAPAGTRRPSDTTLSSPISTTILRSSTHLRFRVRTYMGAAGARPSLFRAQGTPLRLTFAHGLPSLSG